jgi:hypothetical protein
MYKVSCIAAIDLTSVPDKPAALQLSPLSSDLYTPPRPTRNNFVPTFSIPWFNKLDIPELVEIHVAP